MKILLFGSLIEVNNEIGENNSIEFQTWGEMKESEMKAY